MKRILLSLTVALGILSALPAQAQFNPSNGFQTINNTCGTFFLQNGTYYNGSSASVGSTLPLCIPPFSVQNSSAALVIPQKFTTATLPTCNAAAQGLVAITTDGAASPVYNATATGGGTAVVEVLCTGSAWTNH